MSTTAVEIVKGIPAAQDVFLPVMSIDVAVERRETIIAFVKKIMVQDQDFGVIPGTGSKPVLLKPGAEKLCSFFGLEPEFTPITEEVDWTGEQHGGEPFYYIRYRCRLMKNGIVMGVGEGSCNSWESKYRYRNGSRKCPECQKECIIAGRPEYGGGFLCFAKKGGCGAKFLATDKRITGQEIGRIKNPDMADSVNTIQKMAQKRALVPATLLATSGSEFFTQDLEDSPTEPEGTKESRADGQQVAAQSAKAEGQQPTPTQAALEVPGPLKGMHQTLVENKKGAIRQAFDMMKAQLREASPQYGETEYQRIVDKYDKQHAGIKTFAIYWQCILELWNVGEAFRAEAAASDFKASDEDLPPVEDEPEQASLLEETTK